MADTPAGRAVRLYNDRRRRAEFFSSTLFPDHGWDVLLWLFIETERGRRVFVEDAARAARIPAANATRWIAALQKMNLVGVTDHGVMLTDHGRDAMLRFLLPEV